MTILATFKNYVKQTFLTNQIRERNPVDAYDIWAKNYDQQPGNLMLDIDEVTLSKMLHKIVITNKKIADIGCGTGRHWPKILKQNPTQLIGFDVSKGMLMQLKTKFPQAETHQITNNLFQSIPSHSYDVIISTLTIAHIKNIEQALVAWNRILKANADIIITDFHPKTLAFGGKRTFMSGNGLIAVQNFIHHTYLIKEILEKFGFELIAQEEVFIDESFKHYYVAKNALKVYETFKGFPILYGLHFKRVQ
jgi:ubiquinone/menaquinone biosynthesis C-methylase UbiE